MPDAGRHLRDRPHLPARVRDRDRGPVGDAEPDRGGRVDLQPRHRLRVLQLGHPPGLRPRLVVLEEPPGDEREGAADGCRVCYLGAQERLRRAHEWRPDHAVVAVGAQPVWDPRGWAALADASRSIRSQLNRARNKGVAVREWTPQRAKADPRVRALEEQIQSAGSDRAALVAELAELRQAVRTEKLGEVAAEFDRVHSIRRAVEVGSVDAVIQAHELRPRLVEAVERGLAAAARR